MPEEGTEFLGIGVTDACEPSVGDGTESRAPARRASAFNSPVISTALSAFSILTQVLSSHLGTQS